LKSNSKVFISKWNENFLYWRLGESGLTSRAEVLTNGKKVGGVLEGVA
jgi:hypothetical protein